MKTINNIFLGFVLLSAGCKNSNDNPDAYGNFSATEIIISSESAGRVINKNIDEGSTMLLGDIAFVIDTVQNRLKADEMLARKKSILAKSAGFSAQIAVLNEQKKSLDNDLKRFTRMFDESAATQKQLDDLSVQLAVIDKQIEQVKTNYASIDADAAATDASIAQIKDMIKRAVVRSPVKGTVLETYTELGETVAIGKSLFKIADLDEMELKAYFSGRQLPLLKLGEKMDVMIDDGKGEIRKLEGSIGWISSEAEFTPKIIQTREERLNLVYAVKIRVKNDGSIKINMPGEVKLLESVNK
jgi:HlyD family secretion protein